MIKVAIIANPASGKDIRRLVAFGSVSDNQEKVNIIRRVLMGLQAARVDEVIFMPDYFGIGQHALEGLNLSLRTTYLDMPVSASQVDSTYAAECFRHMDVGCIIVLGGDGTNRAVAKGCGNVPLMPISIGTNNVFPKMVEGTIAGMAAGVVANRIADINQLTESTNRLEIERDGNLIDIALVDLVVYDDIFIASRAIWDITKVREIVLGTSSTSNIGFSSIGGCLFPDHKTDEHGVYISLGENGQEWIAPIAPGLLANVKIQSSHIMEIGESVEITFKPSILALDGERELIANKDDCLFVRMTNNGPRVVNYKTALDEAAKCGFFHASREVAK